MTDQEIAKAINDAYLRGYRDGQAAQAYPTVMPKHLYKNGKCIDCGCWESPGV